jgi:hypothetical protein
VARKRSRFELEATLAALWINPRRDAGMVRMLLDLYLDLYRVQDDMVHEYESLEGLTQRLGRTAVPPLLEIFHSGQPDERWAALDMLRMVGQRGDQGIIEAARSALNTDDERLRQTAAATLAGVADKSEVADLAKLLGPMSPHNHFVVIALGQLGGAAAIEALAGLLYQEDRTGTTPYILGALEHIGTPEAFQVIHDWRASDAGRAYVRKQADMRMSSLGHGLPLASMVEDAFSSGDGHIETAQETLWKDETVAIFRKALRDPEYSAWMADVLKRSGKPEALAILKEWQDETQKG